MFNFFVIIFWEKTTPANFVNWDKALEALVRI